MRPINCTLDATTWELAKKKKNFSAWVRSKLLEEYNQGQTNLHTYRSNLGKSVRKYEEDRKEAMAHKVRFGKYPSWWNSRSGSRIEEEE